MRTREKYHNSFIFYNPKLAKIYFVDVESIRDSKNMKHDLVLLASFPVMLILESITFISGTAPSSSEASLLSNSSKNSSPVPA